MGHVAVIYKWKEFWFHRGCSFDVTSILRSGLIAGGRESKGRKTDHLLHTSQPIRGQSRRRRTQRWPVKAWKSTLLQQGNLVGPRLLDQFSPSTRQKTTISANQISCRNFIQRCASRFHLQSDFSKNGKNFVWKTSTPGNRSSSNSRQHQQDTSESASSSTRKLVQRGGTRQPNR